MKYRPPADVIARDRKLGRVLLGGLGIMGVGEMWAVDDGGYTSRNGYVDAPEANSTGEFGTPEWRSFMNAAMSEMRVDVYAGNTSVGIFRRLIECSMCHLPWNVEDYRLYEKGQFVCPTCEATLDGVDRVQSRP